MNISSIIIKTTPGTTDKVIKELKKTNLCEVHLHEGNKIVGLIEAESINEEISAVRKISKMTNIISAEMAFSYCENELDDIRHNISLSKDFPDWLNNDKIKAEQIKYQGQLKKKF
ncbi:MAG: hypothetical protein B6I20_09185 [Bacteroidetes bacterium 4572_117]|nr:MAG: hypothetical protein B6I20_09185 [Bacteroidetes bacterium 4572_117]